jgi:molybdopterin converting factor small subunit
MALNIDLKLFATLSRYSPEGGNGYPLEIPATVDHLICDLGIPDAEVKLVFINGRKAKRSAPLSDGDRVGIFPPVGGG